MDFLLSNFQQIGNALGWALIHFIWQGFILVASYFIITRLFFKNKIHLHYWTGIFFIVLCLIIPIKEFIQQLHLNTDLNSSSFQQLSTNIALITSTGILSPIDMLISLIQKAIPYLVSIWTVVILLISSNLTKSWFELVKLSKINALKVPQNLLNTLEENSKILKLKFTPIISISSQVIIPATFGFFKPVILLPASLISQLPQEQMEAILLHELCHIKRSDFIHNILQLLVETLFFYNPFTKWMSADIRKIREQCCDELVLKLETKPLLYAKALTNLSMLVNSKNRGQSSILQISATDGELLNRIKVLMVQKNKKSPLILLISGILISILALLILNNISNQHSSILIANNILFPPRLNSSDIKTYEYKSNYSIPSVTKILTNEEKKKAQKTITQLQSTVTQLNPHETTVSLIENATLQNTITTSGDKNLFLKPQSSILKEEFERTYSSKIDKQKIQPKISLVNKFPRLIRKVDPVYDRQLRERSIEGSVIISFNINTKGRAHDIKIDKVSSSKLLDSISRNALRKWRFDPKTITEQNIKNRYQQIFAFKLVDSNSCRKRKLGTRISINKEVCQYQ